MRLSPVETALAVTAANFWALLEKFLEGSVKQLGT
jgi:hypothetical protein